MASLDGIEFLQALLTTLFLSSLSVLIPKLLSAISTATEAQGPTVACWIDNLHRHNPFQQWMAERRLEAEFVKSRFRPLDLRTGAFLSMFDCRKLICPNRRWMLLCLIYVLIYVCANVSGALTIMWEESTAVNAELGESKYPAFPVKTGLHDMEVRGNCKWTMVKGSGGLDTYGFVVYQICLDVFNFTETDPLQKNEVRAIHAGKYYKLVWSVETLTQNTIDEYWKVSEDNEDNLEEARGLKDYLEDCDAQCLVKKRGEGVIQAMIHQALKECGMVKRRLLHYHDANREFILADVLMARKTRLKTEAWVTMVGVSIVALLWSLVGVVKTDTETDFAIVTRMSRRFSDRGPTLIATMLKPSQECKPKFVVGKKIVPKSMVTGPEDSTQSGASGPGTNDILRKGCFKRTDIVEGSDPDEKSATILLRVAEYAYVWESEERAKDGMILIAYRTDEDEDEQL